MPIFKPKNMIQEQVLRSSCDIVAVTGAMGSGKSFMVSWLPAYYIKYKIGRGVAYIRRNEDNFKGSGGLFDCFEKLYPLNVRNGSEMKGTIEQKESAIGTLTKSKSATATFANGYMCSFMAAYTDDQEKIENLFKSKQFDKIFYDECDTMIWKTVSYSTSRIRGGKIDGLKRQLFLIQNPERECFLRRICAKDENGKGWINEDGSVDADMNGVVRFFVNPNGDESNIIWGDTKEEVYEKAKDWIDSKIKPFKGKVKAMDMVRSFVFYDVPILTDDSDYVATLLSSTAAESGFDVNWNYSKYDAKNDEIDSQLSKNDVFNMFRNSLNTNVKKKFMTVDYAASSNADDLNYKGDDRSDNCVAFAWEYGDRGLNCIDIGWEVRPSPQRARQFIRNFRDKHKLDDSDIFYDAQGTGGELSNDFPSARKFQGTLAPSKKGEAKYYKRKCEAMGVMIDMIHQNIITINPMLMNVNYTHNRLKSKNNNASIMSQMQFEARSIYLEQMKTGKMTSPNKEFVKKSILKNFSPDLFDNIGIAVGSIINQCYKLLSDRGVDDGSNAPTILIGGNDYEDYILRQQTNNAKRNKILSLNNQLDKLLQW